MTTATQTAPNRDLVLGIIRSLKLSVDDVLSLTLQLITESNREDEKTLTAFLDNRAASKEGKLAAAAGPAISADEAAARLGHVRAAVHRAKDEGRMLAFQEPGKRFYLFPEFQFEGKAVGPWVPELIDVVGNGFAAIHFLVVERKSLKGNSYLKCLLAAQTAEARAVQISAMLRAAKKLVP